MSTRNIYYYDLILSNFQNKAAHSIFQVFFQTLCLLWFDISRKWILSIALYKENTGNYVFSWAGQLMENVQVTNWYEMIWYIDTLSNPMRLFFYPSNFICISAGWCMSINRYDCEDILYEIFAHLDQGFPDQDAHWLREPSGDGAGRSSCCKVCHFRRFVQKSHWFPAARFGPPGPSYKVVITLVITLFN